MRLGSEHCLYRELRHLYCKAATEALEDLVGNPVRRITEGGEGSEEACGDADEDDANEEPRVVVAGVGYWQFSRPLAENTSMRKRLYL
jgi:hypothetical protein